jgi:hypothetical protein
MSRRKICGPADHTWESAPRARREICTTCGTFFPCKQTECGHIDCHEARGEALPEWIIAVPTSSSEVTS